MLAIDQYGDKLYIKGKHPRTELLTALNGKHADKMYIDKKDGKTAHIGYIINNRWFSLFTEWEKVI